MALLNPLFALIEWVLSVFDFENNNLPTWVDEFLSLIQKALFFFPIDVWVIVLINITFWLTLQFGWAILEWIYKKIPGIN